MSSASSSGPLEPPTTLSTDDLTYGVELEFVFAFHEDLIVFPNDAEYKTLKCLPYATRQLQRFSRVNPIFSPNRTYNSWAIESSVPDKVTKEKLNPWKKEPLQIVANILRQNIPAFASPNASRDLYVLDTLDNANKKKLVWDNKKQWKITKDHSVCGVGSQNIGKWLPGKEIQVDKWDSLGVELVSPVLNSNTPNDKVRISEILDTIRKDASQTGAFITNQCGLHVHVQGPDAAQFQRNLNMSEDDAEYHKANNRLGFMKEDLANIFPNNLVGPTVQTSIEDCVHIDCSTKAISRKATIPQIRDGLRKYSDSDVVALMNWPRTIRVGGTQKPDRHLGDKDRQVNMTYMMRTPNLPQTIEFRQAKGSLIGEDVNRWVDFCIGLVRLAHLYAADPSRFRVRNWEDVALPDGTVELNNIDVFDLMRDMELSSEAVTYWEGRVATYEGYVKNDEYDRLDDEVPPDGFASMRGGSGGPPGKRQRDEDDLSEEDEDKKKLKLSPRTSAHILALASSITTPSATPPAIQKHYPALRENLYDTERYYCPDETLQFDGLSWTVPSFNADNWMRMETSHLVSVPPGSRHDRIALSPCNALIQAMRAQYPHSRFAHTKPYELLPIMDRVFRGTARDINEDQIVQVLRQWTDGEFNLVHVTPRDGHGVARRTGKMEVQMLWGRNLFVRKRPATGFQRDHWESLRPATEAERAANGRKRRAGISRGWNFV
ncbi:hypothetical protein BKA61DRAFT_648495 [Leptodontidium sp. MPI-SDFR-AT-0119]|nr:hypothetical protein BKA61DRAFT_648495 [Leptodontidium sp. MPI-SDFR-AT-0119]